MHSEAWRLAGAGCHARAFQQHFPAPQGQSPDGLLEVRFRTQGREQVEQYKVVVEYKSRFPLTQERHPPGKRRLQLYKYAPSKKFAAALLHTLYADSVSHGGDCGE